MHRSLTQRREKLPEERFFGTSLQTEAFYSQDVQEEGLASRGRYVKIVQPDDCLFVCLFVNLLLVLRPRQKYVSSHTVFSTRPFFREA